MYTWLAGAWSWCCAQFSDSHALLWDVRLRWRVLLCCTLIVQITWLGVCIGAVCLRCITMTFELTGDTCALLLVGVACAFRMVDYVQLRSVRKWQSICWKSSRKWLRFRTPRRYDHFLRWPFFALLAAALMLINLINLTTDFTEQWLHLFFLSLLPFSCQSLSSFFLTLITVFGHSDVMTVRPLKPLQH